MGEQSLGAEVARGVAKVFAVIILMVAANWGGYWKGYQTGKADGAGDEQRKAIDAGAGRWVIDPASGERGFVYGVTGRSQLAGRS